MGSHDDRHAAKLTVVVCVVGTIWIVLHGLGLLGPMAENTFALLGIAASAASIIGIRKYRPAKVWPLAGILFALLLFLVGGGVRQQLGTLGDLSAQRSLVPDLITLPGYVLLGVALAGIARARRGSSGFELDATLDAFVASLAALAVGWAFLVTPALAHEDAPLHVRLVLTAYPPMSAFLLVMTLQIAFVAGTKRSPANRLILAAMSFMFVGDVVYMLEDAHIARLSQHVIDVPYALAFLAVTAFMLHPSIRELVEPVPRAERSTRPARLAIVSATLGLPLLITVAGANRNPVDRWVLLGVMVVLSTAAIWRVFRALRAHARFEERLVYQATHDALTGLPNRTYLGDHLEKALARRAGTDQLVALLFLDVDRFKVVNDSMGHNLGDELLVAVAKRLRGSLPRHTIVARVGGDEFVIVLEGIADTDRARRAAEAVRACFRLPFSVRNAEIYASVSIGIAVANNASDANVETMLRDADTAMYEAKDAGRDAVAVFDRQMRDHAALRLGLERDLRNALKNREFFLCYQPILALDSREVVGLEALLRWMHPELGAVPPTTFIPIAEETGIIEEIGAWVLETACRDLARWRREIPGYHDLYVAVNLSVRQLRNPRLIEDTRLTLVRSELPGAALHLELTESMLLKHSGVSHETLQQLRDLGTKLAIDDFGTGYSSLAYLRTFPVDEIKIDKSFVDELDHDDSAEESLVAAIVAMARALGLTTVAEGVETPGQSERLEVLGVDCGQGYVYARPAPGDEVETVLCRLRQRALLNVIDVAVSELR
jgi:diguanylate cyclase (GGDEF)-like protein